MLKLALKLQQSFCLSLPRVQIPGYHAQYVGFVFSWEIGCTDLSLYRRAGLAQRLSVGTHPNLLPFKKKEVVEVWTKKKLEGNQGDLWR